MAATGPALTFDPRYVNFVIEAWQERDLAPIDASELKALVRAKAEDTLEEFTAMGFHTEKVSDINITRSLSLLKSLKLTKDTNLGPKGAKVKKLVPSPTGQDAFSSREVIGWVTLPIVKLLTMQSSSLKGFLKGLEASHSLELPILHPTPLAPKKKDATQKLLQSGLIEFGRKIHQEQAIEHIFTAKTTSAQAMNQATGIVLQHRPLGKTRSLETLVSIGEQLGLIWTDIQQINDVVAVKTIGSAATLQDGVYVPRNPTWDEIKGAFFQELIRLGTERADQSGFVTIEALRGGVGRAFHISPQITDVLLCQAREETDQRGYPLQLYFDENEEVINTKGRQPLVWRGQTYDFVVVMTKLPQSIAQSTAVTSTK